jgi:hypothetical protein
LGRTKIDQLPGDDMRAGKGHIPRLPLVV